MDSEKDKSVNRLQVIKKRLVKVIIYFLVSILILLGSLILLLQIPAVQTGIVQRIADAVSEKINYPITIEGVNIKWFDTLVLENVSINDKKVESLIGVDRIEVQFDLQSLVKGDTVMIQSTDFYSPVVILSWDTETNKLNINDFIYNVRNSFKKKKNKKPKIKPFEILNANIHDGYFAYSDHRKDRKTVKMFDHNYFSVDSIYAQCSHFFLHRDTVQLQITDLKGVEENIDFRLHEIDMFFRYTKSSLEFYDINANIEDSHLSNQLEFRYAKPTSINYFLDSVTVTAHLDSTVIRTKDLAYFAPSVRKLHDSWTFYGDYHGKVGNFSSPNSTVYFGRNSRLKGAVDFNGLPNFKETFMTIDLHNSKTNANDLSRYLTNKRQIREANKFGNIKFDADFAGFPNDFVAHGEFESDLGDFFGDLQFKPLGNTAKYSGHISTEEFNLGKFLDDKRVGTIAIKGEVDGSGFSIDKAKLKLDAKIDHLQINRYNYRNITTEAQFENEFFSGDIAILDSNLSMTTNGTIDLRNGAEEINIQTSIKKAYLHRLNITKDSVFIKSKLNAELEHFGLDDIEGTANISKTFVNYNGNKVRFNDFVFESILDSNNRSFKINSDLFDFTADGEFQFNSIYGDLLTLTKEYGLMFLNDSVETKRHYAQKKHTSNQYHVDFKANFKDVNQLFELLEYNSYISSGTVIEGRLTQSGTSLFDISTELDFLQIGDFSFHNTIIELNSAKEADSTRALAMCYISCEQQDYKDKPTSEKLFFEGIWHQDTINFTTNIKQYDRKNAAILKGKMNFERNKISTSLNQSSLTFLGKKWYINNLNSISYTDKIISFKDVSFNNDKQSLTVNGGIGKNQNTFISLENFQLSNLEQLTKIKMGGVLTGKAKLTDLYTGKPSVQGTIQANDFKIKDEYIGNIEGTCKWYEKSKKFGFNVITSRDSIDIAQLKGQYKPNTKSPLDAKIIFNNTDLGFLEPLLYGHATNIEGYANGMIRATGDFDDLNLDGAPTITDGEFTIDYFKTRYHFEEPIYFKGNKIQIKNGLLIDTLWKTTGIVDGYITHNTFKEFASNLTLHLDNTFVLNTNEDDNSLYYGQAFGSGDISLKGPFNDLKVQSDELSSRKGTKIYIPLDGTESITQKKYIRFISREEKRKERLKKKAEELEANTKKQNSGISADINFDINENAHFEIIFDKKAGDIIRGAGRGDVLLKMDTRGDFDIYGSCEITKGTYNFTLVNLINKAFKIRPGSEISWSGDPYEGKLNITAEYRQNASLLPLLRGGIVDSSYIEANPDLKRRVPVTVLLDLKGRLLSPEIGFDINITDYPQDIVLQGVVQNFHSQIKYNEQQLNNQVFSLMVLKQLSPLNQLQLDVGASSANSVSELFSNQFSYWISQFDENLEVDIDLSGFDEEDNNTFRLRLSYSILDGKMRITRDGNFTNVDNQSQLANVFGEWTIEYLITNDGKLKLKAYNKTNQNAVSSAVNNNTNTLYGLSLTHTTSFNSLKELFKKNPNKSEAKKEEEVVIEDESEKESEEKDQEDESEEEELETLKDEN